MPINTFIHEVALGMLGVSELPLDVRNYLDEIEMYANLAGGSIQSRQVVSLALVNYMDRKELHNKMNELEEEVHGKLGGPFLGEPVSDDGKK